MIVVLSGLGDFQISGNSKAASANCVGGSFLTTADQYPNRSAIVTHERVYTYATLATAACHVSTFLRHRPEFAPGQRVALVAGNTPEYVAGFYGILIAGGIVVPLPETTDSARIEAVMSDCDPCIVLSHPRAVGRLAQTPGHRVDELVFASRHECPTTTPDETIDLHSVAAIFYTSGSTGKPKGVQLSHGNLLANAASIRGYLPIQPSDRALCVLPFCHAYGNSVLQTHLLHGASLILHESTVFPNAIVDALQQQRATSFAAVPETYTAMVRCSDLGRRDLPHLKYMTVAGAALDGAKAIELADRISPAQLYMMYGQTEATARLTYLPPDQLRRRPNSIGRAIPGVTVQVRDRNGREVEPGETGELCARGANVMLGYWRDAKATAQVFKDGWLHTGDLATVDEDGFISLTGRRNDQLKIRGLKVKPREIVHVLEEQLPKWQIAVVPFELRDTTRLALFLAPGQGAPRSTIQIRRICSETLSRHQVPSHIEILDQLPRTASLKIDIRSLSNRATRQVHARHATNCSSDSETLLAIEAGT